MIPLVERIVHRSELPIGPVRGRHDALVSWRWLVDVRGPEPKLDWLRLAIVLAASSLVTAAIAALTTRAVFLVLVLVAAPALVYLDVRLRRESGPN